jgi:hypothetical protein
MENLALRRNSTPHARYKWAHAPRAGYRRMRVNVPRTCVRRMLRACAACAHFTSRMRRMRPVYIPHAAPAQGIFPPVGQAKDKHNIICIIRYIIYTNIDYLNMLVSIYYLVYYILM